jgi:sec-independent protein translocase protein TatB
MFDVSFVELMVVGVVALLVLGPERLPGAARTVGSFVRKARQGWNSVRGEFERQMAIDEVKQSVRQVRESIDNPPAPARSAAVAGTAAVAATAAASTAAAQPAPEPAPGMAPLPDRAPHD